MLKSRLPMNRKEAFFTATVLPGIVCCNDFVHFDAFLHVLDLDAIALDARPEPANIQFFTEYGPMVSVAPKPVKEGFLLPILGNERPDVVIFIDRPAKRSLIAIEAKMFSAVRPNCLKLQMEAQQKNVLKPLADYLKADEFRFALLPQGLVDVWERECPGELSELRDSPGVKIVTWEEILKPYKERGLASYWVAILDAALRDFLVLKSSIKFRDHNDDILIGAELVEQFGADNFRFSMMGRAGGLGGEKLKQDIETGAWKTQKYEVKYSDEPLQNWFPISDFIRKIAQGSLRRDPEARA